MYFRYSFFRVLDRWRQGWVSYLLIVIEVAIAASILTLSIGTILDNSRIMENLRKDQSASFLWMAPNQTVNWKGKGERISSGLLVPIGVRGQIPQELLTSLSMTYFLFHTDRELVFSVDRDHLDFLTIFFVDDSFWNSVLLSPSMRQSAVSGVAAIGDEFRNFLGASPHFPLGASRVTWFQDHVGVLGLTVPVVRLGSGVAPSFKILHSGQTREFVSSRCLFLPLKVYSDALQSTEFADLPLSSNLVIVSGPGTDLQRRANRIAANLNAIAGDRSFGLRAISELGRVKLELRNRETLAGVGMLFAFLGVAMSSLGLIATLVVALSRRWKELSVCFAIGVRRSWITIEVLIEIFGVSLVGWSAGVMVVLSASATYTGNLPGLDLLWVGLGISAVSFLFSSISASVVATRRLRKLSPIEVLSSDEEVQ